MDDGPLRWMEFRLPGFKQTIGLAKVPRPFGGCQWYFFCPMTGDRASVLWRPRGQNVFASQRYWKGRRMAYSTPIPLTGKIDIIASNLVTTPERKQVIDFADPYYVGRGEALVVANSERRRTRTWQNRRAAGSLKGSVSWLSCKRPVASPT